MKVHKLILNGTSDDGARLDDFCERLAGAKFAATPGWDPRDDRNMSAGWQLSQRG